MGQSIYHEISALHDEVRVEWISELLKLLGGSSAADAIRLNMSSLYRSGYRLPPFIRTSKCNAKRAKRKKDSGRTLIDDLLQLRLDSNLAKDLNAFPEKRRAELVSLILGGIPIGSLFEIARLFLCSLVETGQEIPDFVRKKALTKDILRPGYPIPPKKSYRSYRFNKGVDTWDFDVACCKLSECLQTIAQIVYNFEKIERSTRLHIAENRDLSTLVVLALRDRSFPRNEEVVGRLVAIVDYLCYVADLYKKDGLDAFATIYPPPHKIIENELRD